VILVTLAFLDIEREWLRPQQIAADTAIPEGPDTPVAK
jgi:hypothetical protein